VVLTGRVVTSVLLAGKALAEDVADRLSILVTMGPRGTREHVFTV
jgi:hypothetical protein